MTASPVWGSGQAQDRVHRGAVAGKRQRPRRPDCHPAVITVEDPCAFCSLYQKHLINHTLNPSDRLTFNTFPFTDLLNINLFDCNLKALTQLLYMLSHKGTYVHESESVRKASPQIVQWSKFNEVPKDVGCGQCQTSCRTSVQTTCWQSGIAGAKQRQSSSIVETWSHYLLNPAGQTFGSFCWGWAWLNTWVGIG